jgi:replication initiation protein RepC
MCLAPRSRRLQAYSGPAPVRQEPVEKGRVLKLHPDELVRLAPRLKPYLHRPNPTWPELVDAADWLRHDLDVSKAAEPLWGEACLAMGRAHSTPNAASKPHGLHAAMVRAHWRGTGF